MKMRALRKLAFVTPGAHQLHLPPPHLGYVADRTPPRLHPTPTPRVFAALLVGGVGGDQA